MARWLYLGAILLGASVVWGSDVDSYPSPNESMSGGPQPAGAAADWQRDWGTAYGSGVAEQFPDGPQAVPPRGTSEAVVLTTRPDALRDFEQPREASFYFRADYFHWNERVEGGDFVNEDGVLWTFGFSHRNGIDRVRAEFFAGQVDYRGGVQYPDGSSEPLDSVTNYTGARAEFELLYEPEWASRSTFLVGVGSRFWFRDLPDAVAPSGNPVFGYQETWWTFYPYLGWERKRDLTATREFYSSVRIGMTAYTYENSNFNDAIFYPRLGVTAQAEAGIRGRHFYLSAFFESFSWRDSGIVRDAYQPYSQLTLIGIKSGFQY